MFPWKSSRRSRKPEPARPRSFLGHVSHFGLKGVTDAVSLVFCVTSLGLSSLLYLVGSGREIPVPSFFIRHYAKALADQGYGIYCGGLYFDMTGGVRAEDIRITGPNGMDILRVRQAYTHISPENAMGRIPEFDTLILDDATILAPAYVSDSGEETPIASRIHTKLLLSPSKIRVEYVQGVLGGLTTSVTRPFTIDIAALRANAVKGPSGTGGAAPDEILPSARIVARLAAAGRAERYIELVERPTVSITPASDLSSAEVRLLAKSVKYDDATASAIDVQFVADKNRSIDRFYARVDSFDGYGVSVNGIEARLDRPVTIPENAAELRAVTAQAHAHAATIAWRGETLHGVELAASRSAGETLLDTVFVYDGLPVRLSATLGDDRTLDASYELSARLGTAVRLARLDPEKILTRFSTEVPFRIVGTVHAPRELTAARADFEIWGRAMNARGMPIDNAYVRGSYEAGVLLCSEVALKCGDSWAVGSFSQNVKTLDWHMFLKGSVYPTELGSILGRRWWDPIWTEFTFGVPRVQADLDISGNWLERHYANIFGCVDLRDVHYNGVHVGTGSLNLRTGKGYVDINQLVAVADAGTLRGEIAWLLHQPDERMEVTFGLVSELPVGQLDKAFGSVMTEQLPDWTFSAPPGIVIRGNLRKLAPKEWREEIHADAHAENGSWRGIHFDSLDAEVWNDNARTQIKIPKATILGGTLSGTVAHTHEKENSALSLDLSLDETDFTPTIRALHSIGGRKEPDDVAQIRQGKVKLHYTGAALVRDIPGTMVGQGNFTIHNADLAKIKVFGALSTLMDSIGRGYGTFTLDTVSSDFKTKDGFAKLTHTALSGPAVKVAAKGRIGLIDRSLNFDAKVFLLSTDKASLMNIFGTILTPFGYILELNLKGTFEEPSWRFRIDPRNIFGSGKPASANAAKQDAKPNSEGRAEEK